MEISLINFQVFPCVPANKAPAAKGSTMMISSSLSPDPPVPVAVSITVKVPTSANVCTGLSSVELLPSPKSQAYVSALTDSFVKVTLR